MDDEVRKKLEIDTDDSVTDVEGSLENERNNSSGVEDQNFEAGCSEEDLSQAAEVPDTPPLAFQAPEGQNAEASQRDFSCLRQFHVTQNVLDVIQKRADKLILHTLTVRQGAIELRLNATELRLNVRALHRNDQEFQRTASELQNCSEELELLSDALKRCAREHLQSVEGLNIQNYPRDQWQNNQEQQRVQWRNVENQSRIQQQYVPEQDVPQHQRTSLGYIQKGIEDLRVHPQNTPQHPLGQSQDFHQRQNVKQCQGVESSRVQEHLHVLRKNTREPPVETLVIREPSVDAHVIREAPVVEQEVQDLPAEEHDIHL